jgi:hypothetical protein
MSNKNFKIKNGLDVEREITATDISLSDSYPTIPPSLNLDFAKTQNLDPRITFSRNSIATYIANDGLIKIANADQPRFEFDANTKQCKGLLIEEARTNLLTYSENFDNAAWGKVRTTIAANITTAPDGILTADMVVEDTTATNTHRLDSSAITVTNGVTYTFSIYVKAGSRYSFDLYIEDVGVSGAYFNLNTGTISAPQSAGFTDVSSTALITSIGNGWYRCSVIRVSAGTSSFPALRISNGTSTTYTGDGISGLYIWGAQLESGSFSTSYIPTTAAASTRAADLASMTGTNFSSWYNQTEGTVLIDYRNPNLQNPSFPSAYYFSDGTFSNRFGHSSSNTARTNSFDLLSNGTVYTYLTKNNVAERSVAATAYKINDIAHAVDGEFIGTDLAALIPTVNKIDIGHRINSAHINGHISKLAYYPRRLSNSQLQNLTK